MSVCIVLLSVNKFIRIFVRETRHNDFTKHVTAETDAGAKQPTVRQVAAVDPRNHDTHVDASRVVTGLETGEAAASHQLLSHRFLDSFVCCFRNERNKQSPLWPCNLTEKNYSSRIYLK